MGIVLAAAVLAAAPLRAQDDARRQPACVTEASASAGPAWVRMACAGRGTDEAVRFSVTIPRDWRVRWQDTLDVGITAEDGDHALWVVGSDRLPHPRTARDTLDFWRVATELLVNREVAADEVEDFRDAGNGRITSAREWITEAQLADTLLLALVMRLSVTQDGTPVLAQESGVRMVAGEPAGYLSEVLETGGRRWRWISYATVRDGALFLLSLNTPEDGHEALLPVLDRVLASFNPRTERW